jgi:hypothetical protein
VFHIELRQSIHQGRRFNLSREQLDAEFLRPWVSGLEITIDEHDYSPKRAKLKVFEARELVVSELGLGRGWQIVEKDGEDVTERVLGDARSGGPGGAPSAASAQAAGSSGAGASPAGLQEFKATVLGACSLEPRALGEIVRLAGVRHPGARASECLALAEMAVWELLHRQQLAMYEDDDSAPVPPERWEVLVLAWDSWSKDTTLTVHAL